MEGRCFVNSEIGKLKRIMIHAPDSGVGIFPPRAMHELLYDDIVDYDKMCAEYSEYLELLYWYLDPEKISQITVGDSKKKGLAPHFDPRSNSYLRSSAVIDIQDLLAITCSNRQIAAQVVAAVCAMEGLGAHTQDLLLRLEPRELAASLISGIVNVSEGRSLKLFAPTTNLIFTRDTAVTIGDHLFITRPKERARARESLILQYALHHGVLDGALSNLVQLDQSQNDRFPDLASRMSIEGGDMMMIAPGHLLVGLTARTNHLAVDQLVRILVKERRLVEKISVIALPHARGFMHIDTVFTQVKKGLWALFGPFSRAGIEGKRHEFLTPELDANVQKKPVEIFQYYLKGEKAVHCRQFDYLDDLLCAISREDQGHYGAVELIYCANRQNSLEEREQWMDACNFLALEEGVILGYDRNKETSAAFRDRGFSVVHAHELLGEIRRKGSFAQVVTSDTLILVPSAELSRARGGTHCMSMPLMRAGL